MNKMRKSEAASGISHLIKNSHINEKGLQHQQQVGKFNIGQKILEELGLDKGHNKQGDFGNIILNNEELKNQATYDRDEETKNKKGKLSKFILLDHNNLFYNRQATMVATS